MRIATIFSTIMLIGIGAGYAYADQETESTKQRRSYFGGPSSPEVFLNDIERREQDDGPQYILPGINKTMKSWFDYKDLLETDHNLRIGGHYQLVAQKASDALEEPDYSFGGLFRGAMTWTPGGRADLDAGRLEFILDHRHQIGNGVAPSDLGGQIGYQGTTSAIMSDTDFDVYKLAWVPTHQGRDVWFCGG